MVAAAARLLAGQLRLKLGDLAQGPNATGKSGPRIADLLAEAALAPRTVDDIMDYHELHPVLALEPLGALPTVDFKEDMTKKLRQLHLANHNSHMQQQEQQLGSAAVRGGSPAGPSGRAPRIAYTARALESPSTLHVLHYDATCEFRSRRKQPGLVTGSPALLSPQHVEATQLWPGSSCLMLGYCTVQCWTYRGGKQYAVLDAMDTLVPGYNFGHLIYAKALTRLNTQQQLPAAAAAAGVPSPPSPTPVPLFPRAPTNIFYWLKLERRVLGKAGFFLAYQALAEGAPSARGSQRPQAIKDRDSAIKAFRKFAMRELAWPEVVVAEYLRANGLAESAPAVVAQPVPVQVGGSLAGLMAGAGGRLPAGVAGLGQALPMPMPAMAAAAPRMAMRARLCAAPSPAASAARRSAGAAAGRTALRLAA